MLHAIELPPEQAEERERLLKLHRQLTENLACLEDVRRSNPGFEVMVDAFRDLMEVTARAACEAALAIEMVEMHRLKIDDLSK